MRDRPGTIPERGGANSTVRATGHSMESMPRLARVTDLLATADRHLRSGHLSRAVVFYRKVLAATQDGDFRREVAHLRLGDIHLGQRRPEQALPHLRRAYALSGGEPDTALMLGVALLELDRHEEAAFHLQDALGSPVRHAEALAALARTCLAHGDRAGAAALARRAAERDAGYLELLRDCADA